MHPLRLTMLAWVVPGAALAVVGLSTLLLEVFPLPEPTFIECDPNVELERPIDCPPPLFPELGWGHRLLDALASERVAAPLMGAGVLAGLALALAALLRLGLLVLAMLARGAMTG